MSLSKIIGTCAIKKKLVLSVLFVLSIDQPIHTTEYLSSPNHPTLCIMALFDRDPSMCRYAFCTQHGFYSTQTSCSCVSNSKQACLLCPFPESPPRGVISWRSLTGCFLFQACPVLCQFCQTRRETLLLPTFYCFLRLLRQFVVPARSLIFRTFPCLDLHLFVDQFASWLFLVFIFT